MILSDSIYASEALTGHRNRALAYLLRSFDIIETDPTPVLEDYFRACSVMVNTQDLAMMAATLANGGTQPGTGVQVMGKEAVQRTLSVMTTCGMYDDAGAWISAVGLPAKSGVGGGLIAVLPGQLGLAVYSPALDAARVLGARASRPASASARTWGCTSCAPPALGRSAIREHYDITRLHSPHALLRCRGKVAGASTASGPASWNSPGTCSSPAPSPWSARSANSTIAWNW